MTRTHSKGLVTIGIFKLMKALVFFSIGLGALHFINADLDDTVQRAVVTFKFDTESHFVSMVLDRVDMIDDHQLKLVSEATFAYASVAIVEGVGLLMEQTWAEYLTLILSLSFLPLELYEIVRRPSPWRFGIIAINIAIVIYLLWFLRDLNAKKRDGGGLSTA
ncbi:MAG TPA: DUF2127 domain-containing protein [Acidobacteriaceae bacterium]|nr:DUF2127 domain-containing protein [Acidobacteriaceae bacterium]